MANKMSYFEWVANPAPWMNKEGHKIGFGSTTTTTTVKRNPVDPTHHHGG
jgi:hypothetical protein